MSNDVVTPTLYEATVTHSRRAPLANQFRYRTAYWLYDADRPPTLRGPARLLARFDDADHIDVRAALAEHGLSAERIVTLAHARSFGYVFNPISVHWCYLSAADATPVAVVAEVHNTYGGRHAYVLEPDESGDSTVDKALYVSPFYPVDGRYRIRVSSPTERIGVSVQLLREGAEPFVATLSGRRLPVNARTLSRLALRYPLTPLRTSALIRRQGIALWARGLKVVPR
ncbi:MAG: DUF1365 domain-containing protein [Frankiaceae bacterium]|nr:DUF1365 domain-containing protein [Frankiaceae bacterium]MBV9369923.1 DUF1365 domain-containing protein [Frankiales bacterium]